MDLHPLIASNVYNLALHMLRTAWYFTYDVTIGAVDSISRDGPDPSI